MICPTCHWPIGACVCIKPYDKPTVIHHAMPQGKYVVDCGSRAVKRSDVDWANVTCKSCIRWKPKTEPFRHVPVNNAAAPNPVDGTFHWDFRNGPKERP
jgi:hypothetical protein